MVDKIVRYFSDPKYQIGKWLYKRFPDWMPDKWYIETMWRMCMGYNINLKAPKTFNEKLQWLKLYDHNPLYTTLVDKYAVKQWVAEKIGIQYVVPTLAVYDSAEDIDIAKLPNQFVLKCTHDSGSVIICKDKSKFNLNEAKIKLSQAMNVNYYKIAREWPYKNVPHRIIAEPFLGKQDSPNDYKFFCFNGKVKYFKVDFNRFSNHFANYYNRSGELQHFGESAIPTSESIKLTIPKKFLDEMISRAEVLSRDAKFMRVDFYSENENVWFGECTLYPAAGFNPLTNNSMELDWGGQSADCQQVASRDITDYKFFCFDGEPKVMYIGSDRSEHSTSDFFDMDYKHLPIQMKDPNADVMPQKPITFNKMKDLAKVLSQGLPEVRIDFYNVGTNIYFGEMTFFHCAGFTPIKPREWEFYFGDWIKIN